MEGKSSMTPAIHITPTPEGFRVTMKRLTRDNFGDAIDTLKRSVPPNLREFEPDSKTWFVSTAGRTYLDAWLGHMSVAHSASVEWLSTDETSSDAHEHARKPHKPAKVDAYTTLYLLPDAPVEVVKAAYKALAVLHHPDKPTGDTRRMQEIVAAYKQLSPAA
jgi:hypothetical protein